MLDQQTPNHLYGWIVSSASHDMCLCLVETETIFKASRPVLSQGLQMSSCKILKVRSSQTPIILQSIRGSKNARKGSAAQTSWRAHARAYSKATSESPLPHYSLSIQRATQDDVPRLAEIERLTHGFWNEQDFHASQFPILFAREVCLILLDNCMSTNLLSKTSL